MIMLTCMLVLIFISGCYNSTSNHNSGMDHDLQSIYQIQNDIQTQPLTVMVYDKQMDGIASFTDNSLTSLISEKVMEELNICIDFITISAHNEEQKFNILMSSGAMPDISFTTNNILIRSYSSKGDIKDLTRVVDEYGINLKNFLGEEILKYGILNNKQYAIPSKRTFTGKYTTYVRKDWLDILGMDVPTSFEEYIDYLYRVRKEDPGNVGASLVPLGLSMDEKTYENIILPFIKTEDSTNLWAFDTLTAPGAKEGLELLNTLYSDRLINLDFAIDTHNLRLKQNIISGNVGSVTMNTGEIYLDEYDQTLKDNCPSAYYVPCDPFINQETGISLKKLHAPVSQYIFVPQYSQNAVDAIRYLNWMSYEDNLIFIQNKEKTYEGRLNEEAKYMQKGLQYSIIANDIDYFQPELSIEDLNKEIPQYYNERIESYRMSLQGAIVPPIFNNYAKSKLQYNEILSQLRDEILIRSIMSSSDTFDMTYDVLYEEYMEIGGQKIVDEIKAAYKYSLLK